MRTLIIPGAWPGEIEDISDDEDVTMAYNEPNYSPKATSSWSTVTNDDLPTAISMSNIPPIITPVVGESPHERFES